MSTDDNKILITVDNIDEYYAKVNSLIDDYFKWKIIPSALKKYLKKGSIGMDKFIKRNDLSNIKNIEKVILDVVEDRVAMEKDGVLTFENYAIKESTTTPIDNLLVKNVNKPTVEYEKVIADVYRTSLGYISESDIQLHEYIVETGKESYNVIIYSMDDIDIIKQNLIEYTFSYLKDYTVDIKGIDMNIKLDMIDYSSIVDMFKNDETVIDKIKEILNTHEYMYKGTYKNFVIFEK